MWFLVPNCVFIRTKNVKGKQYAYLVENEWVKGRSKQKVVDYLGRVFTVPQAPVPKIGKEILVDDMVSSLIQQELSLLEEEIIFNRENNSFSYKNRPVVLALNGGFLCDHSLAQIMKAHAATQEPRPGTALATAFANAGLRIPQHAFITYYRSVQK